MLAATASKHAKMKTEMELLGAPAALVLPDKASELFKGPRATAIDGSAWDHATLIRALRAVAEEVAATPSGEITLVTVQNLEPSLAQAAFTEEALDRGWARETPDGQVEWIQFSETDAGWIESILQRIKALFTGRANRPPLPAPDPLPDSCRVALVGDWGTGLYGAPRFAAWAKPQAWDAVIHLGDTYYAGTTSEVLKRLSHPWPIAQSPINSTASRFLNGNHEMYSGGKPYFDFVTNFQQASRQRSSCFALQNSNWLLIGLDTSWHGFDVEPAMQNGHIDQVQKDWLRGLLEHSGTRRVILLSHHQPFHFTGTVNDEMTGGLNWLWLRHKVDYWYWGHEHFGVLYEPCSYGFKGRCVGHGGMPETRPQAIRNAPGTVIPNTQCSWKRLTTTVAGGSVTATILDGPNPLVLPGAQAADFAPHGWVALTLNGAALTEEWYLADGAVSIGAPA